MQTINVGNDLKGIETAKERLYEIVDRKTVLFLSGGKTPTPLYRKFAKERIMKPGAVALVDERWGKSLHKDSNEKIIHDTGFPDYLKRSNIPFYGILENKSLKETAKDYDETARYLLSWFPKSVAILGLGADGHIAGIPPRNKKLDIKNQKYVEYFEDFPAEHKERITLTFNALTQLDHIFLLVFGNDKKKGLKLFFEDGPIDEVPARFLKTSPVSQRTLLITDQKA